MRWSAPGAALRAAETRAAGPNRRAHYARVSNSNGKLRKRIDGGVCLGGAARRAGRSATHGSLTAALRARLPRQAPRPTAPRAASLRSVDLGTPRGTPPTSPALSPPRSPTPPHGINGDNCNGTRPLHLALATRRPCVVEHRVVARDSGPGRRSSSLRSCGPTTLHARADTR